MTTPAHTYSNQAAPTADGTALVQRVPQTPSSPLSQTVKDSIQRWDRVAAFNTTPSEIALDAGLTPDDTPALDDAIADLARRLQEGADGEIQPTAQARIEALLGWLSERVAWPAHLAHDQQAVLRQASILAEELTDQPLEALTRAVKAYPKRHRFWPSAVADLYTEVEAEREAMVQLRARLRIMRDAAQYAERVQAQEARRRDPGRQVEPEQFADLRRRIAESAGKHDGGATAGKRKAKADDAQAPDGHGGASVPDHVRAALPGRPWVGEQAE